MECYLNGQNCFAIAPTGSGKSMTYILSPFLFSFMHGSNSSCVILVQPLVALMKEQVAKMKDMGISAIYLGDSDTDLNGIKIGKYNKKFFL